MLRAKPSIIRAIAMTDLYGVKQARSRRKRPAAAINCALKSPTLICK
jgi:hypothetical protein